MSVLELAESATVTLDETGSGIAVLSPGHGEEWYPVVTRVKASSAIREAECRTFCGTDISALTYVDGTVKGSSGDETDSLPLMIQPPNRIFAVWSGGDARAKATLSIEGERGMTSVRIQ